jgi:putative endonuclease
MKNYYVYILSSKRNGTLYTGVTSDLIKRVYEHKNNLADGFTKKYNVHRLVWYETHESAESAINREKQIKRWKRAWKLKLLIFAKIMEHTPSIIKEDQQARHSGLDPESRGFYPDFLDSRFRGNDTY